MRLKQGSKNLLTILVIIIAMTSLGGLFTLPQISKPRNDAPQTYIPCLGPGEQEAQHVHPQLTIVLDGQTMEIPGEIGVEPNCSRYIHTHEPGGEIHVEAPVMDTFYLKDFFSVWGAPFNKYQILNRVVDATHLIRMTVNGEVSQEYENLPLRDKDDIRIEYISIEQPQNPEIPQEILDQLQQQQKQ